MGKRFYTTKRKYRITLQYENANGHIIRLYSDYIGEAILEHQCDLYTHYWNYRRHVETAIKHFNTLKALYIS